MDFLASILHSIGFNWHVALANFINFLIILFILNKFVFKKVFTKIEERQNLIKQGLENASQAENKLSEAIREGERLVMDAKKSGEKAYADLVGDGQAEALKLKVSAEEGIDKLRESLNSRINEAKADVEKEFEKIAPELLSKMLRKVLSGVDEDTHNKLIGNLLK